MDVVESDGLLCASRRTAYPSIEIDAKAAVSALVGANGEERWCDYPVETRPVKRGESVVELAGHGCHGADPVVLPIQQGRDWAVRSIASASGGSALSIVGLP